MSDFLKKHFHRVGEITALKFLVFSNLITFTCETHGKLETEQIKWVDNKPLCPKCGKEAKGTSKNPKRLSHEEIVRLMQNLKKYKDFLAPRRKLPLPVGRRTA